MSCAWATPAVASVPDDCFDAVFDAVCATLGVRLKPSDHDAASGNGQPATGSDSAGIRPVKSPDSKSVPASGKRKVISGRAFQLHGRLRDALGDLDTSEARTELCLATFMSCRRAIETAERLPPSFSARAVERLWRVARVCGRALADSPECIVASLKKAVKATAFESQRADVGRLLAHIAEGHLTADNASRNSAVAGSIAKMVEGSRFGALQDDVRAYVNACGAAMRRMPSDMRGLRGEVAKAAWRERLDAMTKTGHFVPL
eukprot:Opistho-1_new@99043